MSKALKLIGSGVALAIVGLCAWQLPAARADLDDVAAKKKIAAEKLEDEVKQAFELVRKLKPAEGVGVLKTYRQILKDDDNLPAERREHLLRLVNQRITQLESQVDFQPQKSDTKPLSAYEREKQQWEKRFGKDFAKAPSPSDTAKNLIGGTKKNLDYARAYEIRKREGFNQIVRSTGEGAIPIDGYVEFPKHWAKLKELPTRQAGPQLTKQEAAIQKALNSVMSVDYENAPFNKVIKDINRRSGLPIIVDQNSLKEVNVEYTTPVSLQAEKLSVRTILKKILADLNLTYIIKDEVVQVVSHEVARRTYSVRSYYVADLMPTPDPRFGPFFNKAAMRYQANQLMQLIVTTVEPGSWAVNGGQGTIWFDEITQSIVIRQNAEMHLKISQSLGR